MTGRSVIHDTFTIGRSYPAAPSRVFAAFASAEAKSTWGDTGDLEPADGQAGIAEFDFRAGGRERFCIKMQGTTYRKRRPDGGEPDTTPGHGKASAVRVYFAGHYHLGVAWPVPENALGRTIREQRPHFPFEVVKTITE
jgi:hypothetical protein